MFLGGGCSLATEPLAALAGRFYNISMVRVDMRIYTCTVVHACNCNVGTYTCTCTCTCTYTCTRYMYTYMCMCVNNIMSV